MSNTIDKKTAQQIVDTVKDVCGHDINFINEKGRIIASTNPRRIDTYHEIGRQTILKGSTIEVSQDSSFFGTQKGVNIPISYNGTIIAAIGISGEVEEVRGYARLAQKITMLLLRERTLDSLSSQQQNRMNYVLRSLIHGNTLSQSYVDDFLSDYHIDKEEIFRTLLIRLNSDYNPGEFSQVQQKIYRVFEKTDSPLYTFHFPNEYLLFLPNKEYDRVLPSFEKLAASYQALLNIGVGSPQTLFSQAISYRDAELALLSLRSGQNLALYEALDFDLILGSIPEDVRERFLHKVTASLSQEELSLLHTYFEENMSLIRTSERLFLHKNSLQYKLNRIHHLCGYNPRSFQDAVVLYSAVKLSLHK